MGSVRDVEVKDIDLGFKEFKKNLLLLGITQAEVGHFDEDWHEGAETDMATLAQSQEMGFINQVGATVPPRPFHAYTANRFGSSIGNTMVKAAREVFSGKATVNDALAMVGEDYTEDMKQSIDDFNDPENAKSTVKRKGADDPLVDSGDLLDATKYKVRDRRSAE